MWINIMNVKSVETNTAKKKDYMDCHSDLS